MCNGYLDEGVWHLGVCIIWGERWQGAGAVEILKVLSQYHSYDGVSNLVQRPTGNPALWVFWFALSPNRIVRLLSDCE